MSEPTSPGAIDYFAIAKYMWLVVAAAFGYIFKQHVDDDKERARDLSVVQQTYATRNDISELHQKIDENHREVMRVLTRD